MPRPIEFEVKPVLTAAMSEFRQHGFAGTSIKALERATGLSSGSLYNSFGDKDAVFVQALRHYNEVVVARRIADHLTGKPSLAGLRGYFLSLLDEPDGGSSGCLLTNSAIEFGLGNPIIKAELSAGFQMQEQAFLTALTALLPEATDAAPRALKLLALYQGVLVLIRFGHPKPQLRAMINTELNTMTGEKND